MAPTEIRELRRVRRYRNLLVREAVRMKNKVAGLLLEIGQPYVKEKLHRKKYFYPLLEQLPETQNSVRELLAISRSRMELALTWALEVGEPSRFSSIRQAISYCGLCAAQKQSAGKDQRGPLSKQRNKHLQSMLIEAAKLAPRHNETLREVCQHECVRGPRNRATVAVARKLVVYFLAVD